MTVGKTLERERERREERGLHCPESYYDTFVEPETATYLDGTRLELNLKVKTRGPLRSTKFRRDNEHRLYRRTDVNEN